MNNPSLESYYAVVFKYFGQFSCNNFADISSFSSISEKICHMALSNPIQPYLMFLAYLLATNGWSVCNLSNKRKNEGPIMFRGSGVQKLDEKCFSIQNWIYIKKYAYVSKKWMLMMQCFFGVLKELLNSFQTSGNEFWERNSSLGQAKLIFCLA